MINFKDFLKESDVPANVTGPSVSTDQPVVSKSSSNKYKMKNKKQAGEYEIKT